MDIETAIIMNMLIDCIATLSEDGRLHPHDLEKINGQQQILEDFIKNDCG